MSHIIPINTQQQHEVCTRVSDYLNLSETIFEQSFPAVPVKFDLKGRASGMYVVRNKCSYIRFNPYIFSKYYEQALNTTVPHEVAHYVADVLYGIKHIKPHGVEWQEIMQAFGVVPKATGDYDLTGIPVRRQQRFHYRCRCMNHQITASRHNRIRRGHAAYHCRCCGSVLVLQTGATEDVIS